ncbi:OLC1v1010531C1 [Oldenlandia corymbosa var. corymbosa]|uniref:OLC1v1010531C1 n=1 Tax=Oldenlandia corymbosa var. corymbosa TaxID=529605 RepID=A0AAV1DUJ9_OLDCO|nr:OLC1v1010531C1 [Oldenlandia corymbosa var. corymbosa]
MQSGPSTCPYCSASAFPTDQISPRRSTQKTQRQTPQTQATNVAFSANGVDSHGSMTGRDIFEIPPKPGGLENVFCVSILTLSPKFSLYPFPQTPSYLSASQTHTLAPTPKAKGKTSFLSLLSFSLSLSLLLYLKVFIMKGAKSKGKADTKLSVKKGAAKKPVKKGKAAKDPNKPKRPASAFFVFMEDFRKTYKEKHPNNKSVAAVGKAGGDKWKSMSDAVCIHMIFMACD